MVVMGIYVTNFPPFYFVVPIHLILDDAQKREIQSNKNQNVRALCIYIVFYTIKK